MTHHDVVRKLIGPIEAVGESHTDAKRLENLEELTELVDRLVFDIGQAATAKTRHEASMRLIGEKAQGFLDTLGGALSSNAK